MGASENFNEVIDDLKDEVHDLQHDLRASEKECERLHKEVEELIDDQELAEAEHKRQLALLEASEDKHQERANTLTQEVSRLDNSYEYLYHNYVKALSIAETVRVNGNTDYFRTSAGKELLDWAVEELKREFHKITKE